MNAKGTYFENILNVLEKGLKHHNKTGEDLKNDIEAIKEWLKNQPHLPEITDDKVIASFLMMNKFSIENTKEKVDMYYTMRSAFPDFFVDKHPLLPEMLKTMDNLCFIPIPKATPEGYRVIIFQLFNDDPNNFDGINCFAHQLNVAEVRMHEDYPVGDIWIYDFRNFKMGHIVQLTPTLLKKIATIFEKTYNNQLKQLHFLHLPSYAESFISLVKTIMKPKLIKRFYFHKELRTLGDFIPLSILPKDYGGEESSLEELTDVWKRKFAEYRERFDILDTMRVNEELRPTPLINDEVLGFYGNFKKLDVD